MNYRHLPPLAKNLEHSSSAPPVAGFHFRPSADRHPLDKLGVAVKGSGLRWIGRGPDKPAGALFITIISLIAVTVTIISIKLVQAGLVTNFVGTQPIYLLTGPANPNCNESDTSDREITVTWQDRDDNEGGFFIDRQGSDNSTLRLQAPPSPGSGQTASLTDTRAIPDNQYTYTIRSFLGPAESTATTTRVCSTQSPPVQPTNIQVVGSGEHSTYISWSDNSTNEEGFKIYRFPQSNPDMIVIIQPPAAADATHYDDTGADLTPPGLLSNTSYCYYVIAYNAQSSPSPSGQAVCAKTWSQPPLITNLQITPIITPSLTWGYTDPDGSPNGQTKVRVQVCATPFTVNDSTPYDYNDDCPVDAWRWDSSGVTTSAHRIDYFQNYPNGLQQYLLDFNSTYRIRLMVWDDANTPSAWAVPIGGTFTVPKGDDYTADTLNSGDNLTLTGGAIYHAQNGGYVEFNTASAGVEGSKVANGITSVAIKVNQWPMDNNVKWYFRRQGEISWQLITLQTNADGEKEGSHEWSEPANNLEWKAQVDSGGNFPYLIGGFAINIHANRAPVVNSCSVEPIFGNSGDTFKYSATVSDVDNTYAELQVKFDWTGDDMWDTSYRSYNPPPSFYEQTISQQGSFIPLVRAKDSYDAESEIKQCSPVVVGTPTAAWLQTQNADIYSRSYIYGRPLEQGVNATYLVQANGTIVNFTTSGSGACRAESPESCSAKVLTPGYQEIRLPTPTDEYGEQVSLTTVLGAIDLPGILAGKYGAVTTPQVSEEQYDLGAYIMTLPVGSSGSNSRVLNRKIYHIQGNAVIPAVTPNTPIIFDNGSTSQNGSGLFVIDGDLIIQRPIVYTNNQIQSSLKRLASVGWLVKGNVYIDPSLWAVNSSLTDVCSNINQLANCVAAVNGTFYLYNQGNNLDKGIFFTGTNQATDNPLKVGGLVVAQRFALQRNLEHATIPAELFSYDGRIFANTPPGLGDFTKVLPRWRPLAPLP